MSKKKRFGISEALTRGLSETIHVVEHHSGMFRNVVLPLSRIELDPENPRKLSIDLADIRQGIRPDDPHNQRKQDELERLKELAHTIQSNGVINPVIVYKRGELYRVVAGERRCLAAILAGKQEIDARILNEKPKGFELKLIQWTENTAREDLTLNERIDNVRDIIHEYQKQKGPAELNATLLKSILGFSLSQATYYLLVLNAPDDVQFHIQSGNIRNLDKAALISSVESPEIRNQLLNACIKGSTITELRSIISPQKVTKKNKHVLQISTRGRNTVKINMGATKNTEVIKTIVNCVLAQVQLNHSHTTLFSQINWNDLRQATKAFRKLIEILELEVVV